MANIKSLSDLNEGSDEDDGRKQNDYYAGGAKSGQLIRGAPEESDSDDEDDRVGSLFEKARKVGATQGTADDLQQPSGAFKGTGRTLAGGQPQAQQQDGPKNHVITFYNNNIFTVNDGPARRVDDPANFRFIESISKGECPEELDPGVAGAPVTVNLVRKEEAYAEPEKPKHTAFQGSGRTLGSSSMAGAPSTSGAQTAEGEWEGVDDSKPTTSLQLRLADGSRMVARFNATHQVSDIRRFIRASRPDDMGPYHLMTAFPNKLIENENQTLEAAGLLNAVIIQKK